MDERLKQRLTGAIVLIALGVIFIPVVLDGPDEAAHKVKVELPPKPEYAFQSRVVPLPPKAPPAAVSSTPPAPAERPARAAPAPENSAANPPNPVAAPPAAADKPAAAPAPATAAAKAAPAVPAAAATPKAAPVAWVVQVGSFGSEANANKLRAELRKAGFAAFVESEGEGAQKAFKVRVGPETERASADALKSRLQRERKLAAHVRPYP